MAKVEGSDDEPSTDVIGAQFIIGTVFGLCLAAVIFVGVESLLSFVKWAF